MPERTNAPVFFVSYAREDARDDRDRKTLKKFVDALSASVASRLAIPLDGVAFFDGTSIEQGEQWSNELAQALSVCRVGIPIYSPRYFASRWCGIEYQALKCRIRTNLGPSGIVPVLWQKSHVPPVAAAIQDGRGSQVKEYAEVGMKQLARLNVYSDQFDLTVEELAAAVEAADAADGLVPRVALDVRGLRSAWEEATEANPLSHTEGSVSKTCFVFVSKQGWHWRPYPDANKKIGALAQRVSGELDLQYEEILCDAALKHKLEEANQNNVPTILLGDPSSLLDPAFATPLRDYDKQFLLNCAALVAWEENAKTAGESDERWQQFRKNVCPQKTEAPPPYHEWRSIFAASELELKTRTSIESIRSRLLKHIIAEPSPTGSTPVVRKAEDLEVTQGASALGIRTEALQQLEGPTR